MKLHLTSGRLQYEPKFNYRHGVLIGNNWYEDKLEYVKETHKHGTTYCQDFPEKEISCIPPETLWNYRTRGEGSGVQCTLKYDKDKYSENFSTTYDISYNVLPKKMREIKLKKYNARLQHYVPQQDLTQNFGNVTDYGLKSFKRGQWKYELNTEPSSWVSETQDSFKTLSSENYKTPRRAIPRDISSILYKANMQNAHLPLRGAVISMVPEIPIKVLSRTYPHFYF